MTKRRRKLMPELDLPELVSNVIMEYLGPRRLAKLDSLQRQQLSRVAHDVGCRVAELLAGRNLPPGGLAPPTDEMP